MSTQYSFIYILAHVAVYVFYGSMQAIVDEVKTNTGIPNVKLRYAYISIYQPISQQP